MAGSNVITIQALNAYVKTLLERDPVLTDVSLRGEISGFKRHSSGHMYFQLKDATASVNAVMFKRSAANLSFLPENGMQVVVRCRISLYEANGAFQVYVDDLFPDGVGAAQLAYEQLKEKLNAEGLFDLARKRPLPRYPKKIGLVTSRTGAALQDVLSVTEKRYPLVEYTLCSVTVQGADAHADIAAAIRTLAMLPDLDAILVTRGGGSKQDLWVFNSEDIVRAAVASPVPVVSAVGHEIDYTLLDFAADMRAPTPSAAVEFMLPSIQEIIGELGGAQATATETLKLKLADGRHRIAMCGEDTAFVAITHKLQMAQSALAAAQTTASVNANGRVDGAQARLNAFAELATSLNPQEVLRKGYALVRFGNELVKDPSALAPGAVIDVELHKTILHCTLDGVTVEE